MFLATFCDEPGDEAAIPHVRSMVEGLFTARVRKPWAFGRALPRWLGGEPVSFAIFRSRALGRWIDGVLAAERPVAIVGYSSNVGTYVIDRSARLGPGVPRILMYADVDSEKFAAYAQGARGPAGWLYALEAKRVRREEARLARAATAVTLVTAEEAALFREVHGADTGNVVVLPNGVDTEVFDPKRYGGAPAPFDHDGPVYMFTGAMDYRPNVDAVAWFAREVFPAIRARLPAAVFMIVGARPVPAVMRLGDEPGVVVTGRVDSTAAYLAHATAAVAPLTIARGIQNKVLEAMAMARPVIASPAALTGIDAEPGRQVLSAATPSEWVEHCIAMANDPEQAAVIGRAARERMLERYAWEAQFARLDRMLDNVVDNAPTTEGSDR